MVHINNPQNSEVDAYTYIKEELENLGWNIKNPARFEDGEVYKQNEVLAHKELKQYLVRDMPEAVVKLNECDYWVIESKRDKKDLIKALDEAENQYAKKINQSDNIKVVIISGVAGNNSDGFTVCNKYFRNGKWEVILFNGKTKDTLLSKEQIKYVLENKTPDFNDLPDFPEEKYINTALEINEILHNAGINKNKRARFIAGLILALSSNQEINLRIDKTKLLVDNINTFIFSKLEDVDKESFYDFIKLEVPPSKENHIKYRKAIVYTLMKLQTLDIKNAMASGNDILGKFYETFLKYGNGAKEIGIVLTPRHITKFAVEVLDITHNDYVLDVACGTAGFLVSAFDYVRKNSNKKQIDKFKNYNIFGIDQDDEVIALALVNMIFRGDGRNNMREGNCFQKNIIESNRDGQKTGEYVDNKDNKNEKPIITKVLMNPPFALKKSDEKESHFINHALQQMEDGGVLFAIVPTSVTIENSGKQWRKELLENNTLLSVITLPEELFYPVGVHTVGIFIKKGIAHDFKKQNIYFAKANTDGFTKKKGVRITNPKESNRIKDIKEELKAFLVNQNLNFQNVAEFKQIALLDEEDENREFAPEAYLETDYSNIKEEDFIYEMKKYLLYKELEGD